MVGRLLSFWEGLFSRAMLVLGRVLQKHAVKTTWKSCLMLLDNLQTLFVSLLFTELLCFMVILSWVPMLKGEGSGCCQRFLYVCYVWQKIHQDAWIMNSLPQKRSGIKYTSSKWLLFRTYHPRWTRNECARICCTFPWLSTENQELQDIVPHRESLIPANSIRFTAIVSQQLLLIIMSPSTNLNLKSS